MKKRLRLLSLGAAVSLLWSSIAFAMEIIPPNPLSPGVYAESGAADSGLPSVGSQPGGAGITEVPADGTGVGNPSMQEPGNGNLPVQTQETGSLPTQEPGTGNLPVQDPTAGNTPTDAAQESTQQPSALEGTVFAGSGKIAAPAVAAEGAVLLNANTGQIIFEKNARTPFYPASITKVMTALLTVENCNLSDVVTFSRTATTNLESGAVTISLTEGDQLTVKDSLYALLLKSANEVANGLAEHMGGTIDNFANMMNVRAAQLGCTGTHFANPNGLNNATHLTTPYDMALIARAAYANPVISQISTTTAYQMPATKLGAAKTITMGHKMLYPTDSRYYPGMVGGKTGYTSKAGNTLVTCVEQNGVRLVVVVMKAGGTHYTDTKALLDYGFALAANGEI